MHIPAPATFGYVWHERDVTLLVVGLTALMLWLFWRLSVSPWGMALRAIRDSEVAGQSVGLNPVVLRTVAFTMSAVVTGLAGALFAPLTNFVSPSSFGFLQSILFLLVVIIGGAGTVYGPLVGAGIVVLLPEFLSGLAEYRLLFFGMLLLVILWIAPDGVVGAIARRLRRPDLCTARADDVAVLAWLAQRARGQDLRCRDLDMAFGGIRAVAEVSFTARPGQVTGLIGPNGAGKTTVFNLLCGFYRPDAGMVTLGARQVAGLPSYAASRAGIARTYQTPQLFRTMSVLDNVLIALRRGRLDSPLPSGGWARHERILRQRAEHLLAFVGYSGPIARPAVELAHVDKRLVEIARALATQPQVLLLDEPAAGLSSQDTTRVGQLLRQVAQAGVAVVLVEHDMPLVMGISDYLVVLDAGRCIAAGSPVQVRHDPAVRAAYLGRRDVKGRSHAVPRPNGSQETILAVQQLSAGYGGAAPAIEGVDLAVHAGELVAVLGANGAGKSTLMRALSGLHRPLRGSIRLRGQDMTLLTAHRIARAGLVLVPEGRQVFPELTVLDNIRLGAYARKGSPIAQEVEQMLGRFPALRARLSSRAGLLSGGEQQMLALARGLIARPALLLLDEPSLGLAPFLRHELFATLAALCDAGVPILLTDQMAGLALAVAERGYVLQNGRMVHEGAATALRNDPALERAYLGDTSRHAGL